MTWNVFYAWQSDRPPNVNRNLIEKALEEAIRQVREDGHLEVDPRLDKDTMGVPGSPDIPATILAKIREAAVFVADVTIITTPESGRPCPNPNVLIELGYALRELGPKRVVLVMNKAFGGAEQLPFDIRQHRALVYELPADAPEKAPERKRLQSVLVEAVRAGLVAADEARPRTPAPPSAADELISAIEQKSPSQRSAARRFSAELLRQLDAAKPANPASDEELVAAISASVGTVLTFWRVAEVVASHRPDDVLEELLRAFEQLLRRYDIQQGFVGASRTTDFDFYKFVGHELFVLLTAALMREEAWQTLDALLRKPLHLAGTIRNDQIVAFDELSQYTAMLDEVRRNRLKTSSGARTSIHADILKDRYSSGALADQVGWETFTSADFFLFVRSRVGAGEYGSWWRPWTALFWRELPPFVTRSESKDYASRVVIGLGLPNAGLLATTLQQSLKHIENLYPFTFWRPPGRDYDFKRLASS